MGFISPLGTDSSGQPLATGSAQELGKNDFLELLVTKLQYQDPLEPMQDEDFIAQLAQFSSLEQMQNISDGIEASNQWDFLQMQSLNNTMASGLIGQEVKASYEGIYVDGNTSPTVSYTLSEYASELEFTIRDESGSIVATLSQDNVSEGTGSIVWDGKDSMGNTVPEGYYTVSATGTNPAGETFEPSLSLVGLVSAISYRDGAAYLSVGGTEIPLSDVQGIGMPGTFTGNTEQDDDSDSSSSGKDPIIIS